LLVAACGLTAKPHGVELINAPAGTTDVAALVRKTARQTAAEKRRLVVYVGATWCEPCKAIHEAAEQHRLDDTFPDLALLVFDLDRDGAALKQAGYESELIPLFVLPDADGRAGPRRQSGGVHEGDNVKLLTDKLHELLD
jgi:hypothetical protein